MKLPRNELAQLLRSELDLLVDKIAEYTATEKHHLFAAQIQRVRQSVAALTDHNVQLPVEVPAGFIRVRIAVGITEKKQWHAWGAIGAGDAASRDQAVEGLVDDGLVHFIEADIPVPQSSIVEGVVT